MHADHTRWIGANQITIKFFVTQFFEASRVYNFGHIGKQVQ